MTIIYAFPFQKWQDINNKQSIKHVKHTATALADVSF